MIYLKKFIMKEVSYMYNGPCPKSINKNFQYHSYSYIVCLLTGNLKKKIENRYLLKYGHTKETYQKMFPDAPMTCKQSVDNYKNVSEEVKKKRSETMRNLNLNNKDFNKKRIEKMKDFWKDSEKSDNHRKFYSEKAKKQHEEGSLTDSVREYFKTEFIGSENQKNLCKRMTENNPWANKEIRKKMENDWLEKYGFDNPARSEIIKEKVKQTNIEKYNGHYNQQHFTENFKKIISSLDDYTKEIEQKSPNRIANEQGVTPVTVIKYGKNLGYQFHQKRSSYEIEIENWLKEQEINYISNTRSIISPLELDFYLPDYNVAIEFNGLYWHSDIFKEKDYHLNKYLACKEKDIRLISINEDEWIEKSDLIKSKILNIIGKSERGLPARKLFVSKIDSHVANKFCEKYHIQGKTGQVIYAAGAFDDCMVLVGVMLFNQQRNTQDIELIRFCTDGKVHNGLFSKLLKHSLKDNDFDKIISFADLRYSEGNLYEKTGFTQLSTIKPDYMYVDGLKRVHKSSFAKNSIKKKKLFSDDYIDKHTEKELTEELGLCRIYDIGKIKYIMELKKPS